MYNTRYTPLIQPTHNKDRGLVMGECYVHGKVVTLRDPLWFTPCPIPGCGEYLAQVDEWERNTAQVDEEL